MFSWLRGDGNPKRVRRDDEDPSAQHQHQQQDHHGRISYTNLEDQVIALQNRVSQLEDELNHSQTNLERQSQEMFALQSRLAESQNEADRARSIFDVRVPITQPEDLARTFQSCSDDLRSLCTCIVSFGRAVATDYVNITKALERVDTMSRVCSSAISGIPGGPPQQSVLENFCIMFKEFNDSVKALDETATKKTETDLREIVRTVVDQYYAALYQADRSLLRWKHDVMTVATEAYTTMQAAGEALVETYYEYENADNDEDDMQVLNLSRRCDRLRKSLVDLRNAEAAADVSRELTSAIEELAQAQAAVAQKRDARKGCLQCVEEIEDLLSMACPIPNRK